MEVVHFEGLAENRTVYQNYCYAVNSDCLKDLVMKAIHSNNNNDLIIIEY